MLALKGNQPTLPDDVRRRLDDPDAAQAGASETVDGDHGRIETRHARIIHAVAWLAATHAWPGLKAVGPGLKAVGKVTASREIDGQATTATRDDLLARPLTAARFAEVVRTYRRRGRRSGPAEAPAERPARGRSRTACTGSATWSWTRTSRVPARTTRRRT